MADRFALPLPPDLVAAIAEQVADAVIEQLPDRPEPYLNVEQAAEYLACRKPRIYELVEAEHLRTYRDGRRLLFRREDLDGAVVKGSIE
jgi:excisionase family DNA binding protein